MNVAGHGWRLLSASVIGSGHLARGGRCEDSIGYRQFPDNSWIAVIADGAGSARYASEASALVVEHGMKFLATLLPESLQLDASGWTAALRDCASETRNAISEQATKTNAPLSEFSTTVITLCVTNNLIAAMQIGDGGVVICRDDEPLSLLFSPTRGEYINETSFITSPIFPANIRVTILPAASVNKIAAFTDGIEFLGIDMKCNEPYAAFFDPLFDFSRSEDATSALLEVFLASERVCARTDDDKTLLLATRA